MVYLPMGYLYGSRFIYSDAEKDPLIADLRKEVSLSIVVIKLSVVYYVLTYLVYHQNQTALLSTLRFDSLG